MRAGDLKCESFRDYSDSRHPIFQVPHEHHERHARSDGHHSSHHVTDAIGHMISIPKTEAVDAVVAEHKISTSANHHAPQGRKKSTSEQVSETVSRMGEAFSIPKFEAAEACAQVFELHTIICSSQR